MIRYTTAPPTETRLLLEGSKYLSDKPTFGFSAVFGGYNDFYPVEVWEPHEWPQAINWWDHEYDVLTYDIAVAYTDEDGTVVWYE